MNRSRIVSALLACLLVTAGVAGPLSQPAVAAEAGNCSDLDDFVMFLTLGAVNGEDCSRQAYVDAAIEDYSATETEQLKVDIYSRMSAEQQAIQSHGATFDNYINDTETVAWSKMQVAVAEAYQNGSSKAQAQYEAEKAIEEYYAVKQRNLVSRWNSYASEVEYTIATAKADGNISLDEENGFLRYTHGRGGSAYKLKDLNMNRTVTLVNGTDVQAKVIGASYTKASVDSYTIGQEPFDGLYIGKPTSSYESSIVIDQTQFPARWSKLQQKKTALIAESDTFINATYADYEDGTVNASDVISSQTAMFEYGTRSGDTNESLYDTVGALALAGFDTPSLNGTGTMDVRYNNQTYTGLVMARTVPGGSWSANTTYNTSNIDGPVFIATTTGEKIDILEGESFTIEAIRAQDGSSISSVSTTRYNYKTSNASELIEVQEQLTALRTELEEREPSGGAGGGSGGFGGNTMLIVLAVAAAAAIALGSQNGGGGQGRGSR